MLLKIKMVDFRGLGLYRLRAETFQDDTRGIKLPDGLPDARVDANGDCDRRIAIRVGRHLNDLGIAWLEEPAHRFSEGMRAWAKRRRVGRPTGAAG